MNTKFLLLAWIVLFGCTEDLSLDKTVVNRDLTNAQINANGIQSASDFQWTELERESDFCNLDFDPLGKPVIIPVNGELYSFERWGYIHVCKFNKTKSSWELIPFNISERLSPLLWHGRKYVFSYGAMFYTGLWDGVEVREPDWNFNPTTTEFSSVNVTTLQKIQRAPFPGTPVRHFISFAIGSKGYVMGGYDIVNKRMSDQFWEYDFIYNHWTNRGTMPGGARAGATVFVKDNLVYMMLGFDRVYWSDTNQDLVRRYKKDVFVFDAPTGFGAKVSDFPGEARAEGKGFIINNKMYVGWGFSSSDRVDAHDVADDFWEYDPSTNIWKERLNCSLAPEENSVGREAFSVGNTGYVVVSCLRFWKFKRNLTVFPDPGDGPILQPTNP